MKYILLLFLFCSVVFLGCKQRFEIYIDSLRGVEKLINVSPDSALFILQEMQDNVYDMSDKERAIFGLLTFKALDRSQMLLEPMEMIDFSLAYYAKENLKKPLAQCYFYKVRACGHIRDYVGAIQNGLEALEMFGDEGDNNFTGGIYFELGRVSGLQSEFIKSLEYYYKSIECFEKSGNKLNKAKLYRAVSDTYLALNEYDRAIESAKKTLALTNDSITVGDLLNSIGTAYLYKEDTDSALIYLKQSITYPYYGTNMSLRYYNLGNVYSVLDSLNLANYYVNKAFKYPIDIYIEEECYRVLTKVAMSQKNNEGLSFYLNKRNACADSIKVLEKQTNIHIVEKLHHSDKTTKAIKNHRFLLFISIISLLIISGFVLRILYLRNKQKQRKADMLKNQLDEKQVLLEEKDELLEEKHEQLEKKNELLLLELTEELEKNRARYADAKKKASFEEREKIERTIYNNVLHFDEENLFIDKMNKVLNSLPDKLKKDYPEISYKEILWCCLFMLQIPTPDIALILDYKQSSLYKFKQRFGKKLAFSSLKELEEMLQRKVSN